MFILSRAAARSFHQVLRKAGLHKRCHSYPPFVWLSTDRQGLTLQAMNSLLSASFLILHGPAPETLALPVEYLAESGNSRGGDVVLTAQGEAVTARWTDNMQIEREYEQIDQGRLPPVPSFSTDWCENSSRLLEALRAAMATTDPDSVRHAMGCVQLDPTAGRISATDGSQALVQSGFQLPGSESVLIPASKIFQAAALPRDVVVQVGRTEQQVVFQVGPWTIGFTVQTDRRFPDVERIIPTESAVRSQCI